MDYRIAKPIPPSNQICEYCGKELYIKTLHGLSHDGVAICLTDDSVKHNPHPLFYRDSQWYFWDETWSNETGPFSTYHEAAEATQNYYFEEL